MRSAPFSEIMMVAAFVFGTRHGVAPERIEVVEAPYTMEAGRAGLSLLLNRKPSTTAVFCGSDILAIGALDECRQRGISVPSDLSIIGFDNLEIAEFLHPPLTTIAIPAESMGTKAAEYLLADPEERQLQAYSELQTQLIMRDTTRPPRRSY